MRIIVALSVLAILAVATFGVAAQDSGSDQVRVVPVPGGEYEHYGTWAQIQLGATSLMNPKKAEGAAVVYSYAVTGLNIETLEKAKSGAVAFATKTDNGQKYATVAPDEAERTLAAGGSVWALSFKEPSGTGADKLITWQAGH